MKENFVDQYPYVVVQFLDQLPNAIIGDYVGIPRSWIRVRRATDTKSIVAYPDESPSITKMRIINRDEPSYKWKLYMAIVEVEVCSYKDAYEYIMAKIHTALRKSYLAGIRTNYECVPATAKKRHYSPSLKTINLPNPQSKKNRNKLKVVDNIRQSDTILNSNEYPDHSNVESRTLTSSNLTGAVSSENPVIKENYKNEHRDQSSSNVLRISDDLLLRYPYIQQKPEEDEETEVNSSGLSISREYLHHIALTEGIQVSRIPNFRTFTLDLPEPLIQDPNIGLYTSFAIQNLTNEDNQFSQLEISQTSPVIQEHPQVVPKQKIPDHSSEVECATSEPTTHSKMTSVSDASIVCTNSAEHQDSIVEDMVVDELTDVSCIEQNVLSGTSAEKKSSANPKSLEEPNYSGQTIESSMEEESPMVEAVTSSAISSTQDFDNDKQSNSSDLSSDEIITTSLNSKEQANQSVISVLNQADIWADQLYDIYQKMKINYSETCQLAHDLHESLVQTQKVIECIANASKNSRELKKGKVAVVTPKEVTAEVQQIAEVNQAEKKEEGNLDVSMQEDGKENNDVDSKTSKSNADCGEDIKDVKDQDRDNEVPKTTRGHIRTFILPPEYNPNNSKWTLKYPKNDPKLNLVELVPGSSVFINFIKLAHCMRSARDSKALARRLLEEIFTQSALSVCSLTGVRANAFDINGTNVRPGLDANARMAILTFVEKQTLQKKWGAFDSQSVINTLRSKIQDIRAKHAKTAGRFRGRNVR